MPKVHFIREDKELEVPSGTNLRKWCKKNKVPLYPPAARAPLWISFPVGMIGNCRGHGICGTCVVRVDDPSAISPKTHQEEITLGADFPPDYRLSCQIEVTGDCRILTQPQPPLGWHVHPAYKNMAESNPFEGMPPIGQEAQAEAQAEGLADADAEGAVAGGVPPTPPAAPAAGETPAEA